MERVFKLAGKTHYSNASFFNLQSTPLQAEFCTQVFFSKGKL